eukprot:6090186-Amphidinium_carterae.1
MPQQNCKRQNQKKAEGTRGAPASLKLLHASQRGVQHTCCCGTFTSAPFTSNSATPELSQYERFTERQQRGAQPPPILET